ncbi:MAG: hypothetical protein JWL63_2303 [Rhodocyclales bacterium]|nr:hypothetical protein [Rhodocyclales bacterium]
MHTVTLIAAEDGTALVLPSAVCERLNLKPGDDVLLSVEGGSLKLQAINAETAVQIRAGLEIMAGRSEVLRALAKD